MKKLIFYCFALLFFNPINADDINESNFLEFLSEKQYFSADFIQTTFKDDKETVSNTHLTLPTICSV